MTGKEIRLCRLFGTKDGNATIVAFDHGMMNGPVKGFENLDKVLDKINLNLSGVLMGPGTLKNFGHKFARRNTPLLITRLTWSPLYAFDWKYNDGDVLPMFSVEHAVELGADVVLCAVHLKTGSERRDAENISIFTEYVEQANRLGVPIIGEVFPCHHDEMSDEEMHDFVLHGCRIMEEVGADAIKTFHTHKFEEVIGGVCVPVLGLGSVKTPTQLEALQLAKNIIDQGGRGVVFGRNAIQVKSPNDFQQALIDVVNCSADPKEVVTKYNLED
jgi:DhnA family fructose-bisphosphate aldolase class Ia